MYLTLAEIQTKTDNSAPFTRKRLNTLIGLIVDSHEYFCDDGIFAAEVIDTMRQQFEYQTTESEVLAILTAVRESIH